MTRRLIGTLAAVAFAAGTTSLAAQQPPASGGMGGMRMMQGPTLEGLTTALKLDSAQQVKVKELLDTYQAETKAPRETMMENMGMVREGAVTMESVREANQQAMTKIREQRDKLYADIKALLTAEQVPRFDTWLSQQRMGGRRPPPA
jgi:Spy/CpxP family protein refolding chaperone